MTTPRRKITETDKLITDYDKLPPGLKTPSDPMLLQILSNQRTILSAVETLLIWDDE